MKAKLTLTLLLITAVTLADAQNRRQQITYTTERDIPYREADANEYARNRCLVDFYYPENVKDFPTVKSTFGFEAVDVAAAVWVSSE